MREPLADGDMPLEAFIITERRAVSRAVGPTGVASTNSIPTAGGG